MWSLGFNKIGDHLRANTLKILLSSVEFSIFGNNAIRAVLKFNQNRDVGTCQIFEEKHYLFLQIKRLWVNISAKIFLWWCGRKIISVQSYTDCSINIRLFGYLPLWSQSIFDLIPAVSCQRYELPNYRKKFPSFCEFLCVN